MRILSLFGPLTLASALALAACANSVSLGHDTGGSSTTSTSGTSMSTTTTGSSPTGTGGSATTGMGGSATTGMGGSATTGMGGSPTGMGGSTTTTTTTSGGPPAADSIAMLDSAVPASVDTSTWLKPGQSIDASTLVIVIDSVNNSLVETCASPHFDEGTVNHDLIVVGLPAAMQAPGTYMFSSPEVIAWGSTWLTDGMGNGGGGASTLSGGSIEIVSIDASSVVYKLASLPSGGYSVLEGEHTASRCP